MTVASALVSALAAPLREVQALVGAGGPPDPALTDVRDALGTIAAAARRSWADTGTGWWGVAADNAAQRAAETAAAADALAERTDLLAARVRQAGAAVGWVRTRLQAIVDGFEHRANALEPRLDEPGVAEELLTEAHDALRDAIAVVEQLRAELDQHAAAITPVGSAPPTVEYLLADVRRLRALTLSRRVAVPCLMQDSCTLTREKRLLCARNHP